MTFCITICHGLGIAEDSVGKPSESVLGAIEENRFKVILERALITQQRHLILKLTRFGYRITHIDIIHQTPVVSNSATHQNFNVALNRDIDYHANWREGGFSSAASR